MCDVCLGPLPGNCDVCVANATKSTVTGCCECNSDWEGDTCNKYRGTCHSYCDEIQGCNGPLSSDCI